MIVNRGWTDKIRHMTVGEHVTASCEREKNSFIQTMRMCGAGHRSRKQSDGTYLIEKISDSGPVRTESRMVWRKGVQVKRRVILRVNEKIEVGGSVLGRLRSYCDAEGFSLEEGLGRLLTFALESYDGLS